MSLVLSNKGKGMQSSSEQPLVGEERYVTTRITAAKETMILWDQARNPERALSLHLPRSGSQSQRAISFISPAHGACPIINNYTVLAL